jgi:hypothetical protein
VSMLLIASPKICIADSSVRTSKGCAGSQPAGSQEIEACFIS